MRGAGLAAVALVGGITIGAQVKETQAAEETAALQSEFVALQAQHQEAIASLEWKSIDHAHEANEIYESARESARQLTFTLRYPSYSNSILTTEVLNGVVVPTPEHTDTTDTGKGGALPSYSNPIVLAAEDVSTLSGIWFRVVEYDVFREPSVRMFRYDEAKTKSSSHCMPLIARRVLETMF